MCVTSSSLTCLSDQAPNHEPLLTNDIFLTFFEYSMGKSQFVNKRSRKITQ